MVRGLGSLAQALTLVAPCLLVAVAAEWPYGPSNSELLDPGLTRRILQKNITTTTSTPEPARLTGALALYSLFGLFLLSSVVTCVIGIIATLQWPNPRICCYRTPYSDIPSSESCGCCALHRLNIGFAVTWLALLVLLVLALIIYLMVAAAVLAIVHAAIAYRLVRQLKLSYADGRSGSQMQMAVEGAPLSVGLVTGLPIDRPLPGVPVPGIPVVSVPMSVAVVEAQLQTHLRYRVGSSDPNRTHSRLRGVEASGSSFSSSRCRAGGNAWQPTPASPAAAPAAAGTGGGQTGGAAAAAWGGPAAWQQGEQAEAAEGQQPGPDADTPGADLQTAWGANQRGSVLELTMPPSMLAASAAASEAAEGRNGGAAGGQASGSTTSDPHRPQRGGWLPAVEDGGVAAADGSTGAGGGSSRHAAASPHAPDLAQGGNPSER